MEDRGERPESARQVAERVLAHPVPALLAEEGRPIVAGSLVGDPPRARVAWVDPEKESALARVSCPPGRPSRWRPLVATVVSLDGPGLDRDRVLVAQLAPEAAAVRPVLAVEHPPPDAPVGPMGLVIARLPLEGPALAIDALDRSGEPIGRLARPGISEMRFDGSAVSGRLGATHGMAAGVGAGRWSQGIAEAAFEVGYDPWLPAWIPPGLTLGRPRVEPDIAYPAAPPALVLAWMGERGERVLLRQAPAPLASPDPGGRAVREVRVGSARATLRGRRLLVMLVWETAERAFGIQVRGLEDPEGVALRVARSVAPGVLPAG